MSERAYRAPAGEAGAEIKERGSRFVAVVRPAGDEPEAEAAVAAVAAAHRDASHCCWAWRLGEPARERWADAGEPHGTAGRPMLEVLRGAGLSDVVAVVLRWFGGVKLGKGGLARAYAGVVRAALAELPSEPRRPALSVELEVPFDRLGAVQRLLRPPRVELEKARYGDTARLLLRLERRHAPALAAALADLGLAFREPGES